MKKKTCIHFGRQIDTVRRTYTYDRRRDRLDATREGRNEKRQIKDEVRGDDDASRDDKAGRCTRAGGWGKVKETRVLFYGCAEKSKSLAFAFDD